MNLEIEQATELAALKPIYFRLKDIEQNNPDDFDVFFAANETRQHLIARGAALQQPGEPPSAPPPLPPFTPPSPASYSPPPAETFLPPQHAPAPPLPEPPPPVRFSLFDDAPAPPTEPMPLPPLPEPEPPPARFSLFDDTPATPAPPAAEPVPPPPPFTFTDSAPPKPPQAAAPEPTLPVPIPPPPPARPPAPARAAPIPPAGAARPPAPPRSAADRKRMLAFGAIAVLAVAMLVLVFTVTRARRLRGSAAGRAVAVDVATNPPGAVVRVVPAQGAPAGSKETTCTSNCRLALAPGDYQVTASLAGFEPAAGSVHVAAGQPAQMNLPLRPQAQSVRLLTDLDQGKVVLDDQPPADLQEGQLVLDRVTPGSHTVKLTGRNAEAAFTFEIADARLPAVGQVTARNLMAVLVASFGKAARVVTSSGPVKLAVNGQPQGDAGPAGVDVANFQPGVDEIVLGEGKDQRNMSENFGAAPMITAFLKSDVNAGTLIVSTGQDDVRVFLNGREYRRRTQRGQLRIQTLGKVTVRVAKDGFLDEPAQTAEVKKGEEVRLQFGLKPQPQYGSLQIRGGTPGAEVMLDQKPVGAIGADGTFVFNMVQPGDRAIELRHAQYAPKRLRRTFQMGQTVTLAGADVVLASANGTIHLTRNPAGAIVSYRRADETESHEVRGNEVELPAGNYVLSATAPGFSPMTATVPLAGGENRVVEFTMVRERPAIATPTFVTHGMEGFEEPQAWKKDGDDWVHKGAAFLAYKLPPRGVFTFTVELLKGGSIFRAGKIRWCVQYIDSKNYLLTEMDRKNFWTGVIEKGNRLERTKGAHHLENQKAFTMQIEITPEQLVQRVQAGNGWTTLDTFTEAGRDFTKGKFGFLVQGNDEIAISNFKFVTR